MIAREGCCRNDNQGERIVVKARAELGLQHLMALGEKVHVHLVAG